MIRKVIFILLSFVIITGAVYAEGFVNGNYVETVSVHNYYGTAIKADGSLVSWGNDDSLQVTDTPTGTGFVQISAGNAHATALKEDGSLVSWGTDSRSVVTNTPTGTDFVQVSCGATNATALKTDGSLVSWGRNFANEVNGTPTGTDFVQVSCGYRVITALKADGSLVSWGSDTSGVVTNTPTGTDFVQVSTGGSYHSTALREDGSLVSWGSDINNQVTNTPTGTNFVQVSSGYQHVTALKADGSLVSWGVDNFGQVSSTPTGTDFVQVTSGLYYGTALKADGTLVSWGRNLHNVIEDTPTEAVFGDVTPLENVTNISKTIQEYTGITVTWQDPVDSDHVNVYLNDVYVGNTTLEQYELTGLDPATEYKITLENEFESEIASGFDVFYSTKTIQNVTGITTDFVTPTEISLTWTDAPDYDSYDIYLDGVFLKNTIIPSTMITDLQPNLQYEIEIVTDIEGHKSSGIKYFETTLDSPFIVTGLHVDYKTDEMIRIAYNEYQNAELYKIYVNDVYEGETSSLYYNITGLLQDTAYKIEITAVIGTWESQLSLPITVSTEASMEAIIPQNVVLLDSGTAYLQVGWNNEPLNTFYEVMVDNEFYGSTTGDEITIMNLDYATEYLVAVRSVKQHNSWTYESDWVYNTFSTAEIPPGVTYLTLLQEKMYSIVIQWDYVPEATKYRIYVNNKLHSIHEHDDPNQLEIDVRPGWDYSIYATLFTAGVTESEKSNTLYINLDIPIHDVETEEMLARAVDIFKGSWPMIAILMGLVIAAKIVQVITKYLQRV